MLGLSFVSELSLIWPKKYFAEEITLFVMWYCDVCGLNIDHDKNSHSHSQTHISNLTSVLEREQNNMKQIHKEMQNPILFAKLNTKNSSRQYLCFFCATEIDDSTEQFHK